MIKKRISTIAMILFSLSLVGWIAFVSDHHNRHYVHEYANGQVWSYTLERGPIASRAIVYFTGHVPGIEKRERLK